MSAATKLAAKLGNIHALRTSHGDLEFSGLLFLDGNAYLNALHLHGNGSQSLKFLGSKSCFGYHIGGNCNNSTLVIKVHFHGVDNVLLYSKACSALYLEQLTVYLCVRDTVSHKLCHYLMASGSGIFKAKAACICGNARVKTLGSLEVYGELALGEHLEKHLAGSRSLAVEQSFCCIARVGDVVVNSQVNKVRINGKSLSEKVRIRQIY